MVYITGDCHADWRRFSTKSFPEQMDMTREDFVIVCGDFGIWHDNEDERYHLDWLASKNFTLLFVDGNHENFDRLYGDEFEVVDFYGGKAHKIRDNIYHLMRGYVFELCGKKFFAFGGASSHDIDDGILDRNNYESDEAFKDDIRKYNRQMKMFRINHISWWQEELPSQEEMDLGINSLLKHDNTVDYIVSHCAPAHVAKMISWNFNPDIITEYFNTISESTNFKKWFFGHYHDNKNISEEYVLLYEQIVRVA